MSTLQLWLKDHRQGAKDHQQGVKFSKPGVRKSRQAVTDKDTSPATFIPVHLIGPKSTSIEIVTPNGFTLKLTDVNPQYIAELLGILGPC